MIGYISFISHDGTSGTIREHVTGTPYSFYNYSGPALSYQQRVSFGTASNGFHPYPVNIAPVLDSNGVPIFDEPLPQRLSDTIATGG